MTHFRQPRIGPDRRVRDRRSPPAGPALPEGPARRGPSRAVLGVGAALTLAAAVFATTALGHWPDGPAGPPGAVAPRERAEALCWRLAESPRFSPTMRVEPAVSVARGRAAAGVTLPARIERALALAPERVLRHWSERVGDFDVATLWVRLADGDRHALVLGWVEDGELAVVRFRFAASGPTLGAAEIAAGDDLLDRTLAPRNFRAGALPPGAARGSAPLPAFGPAS